MDGSPPRDVGLERLLLDDELVVVEPVANPGRRTRGPVGAGVRSGQSSARSCAICAAVGPSNDGGRAGAGSGAGRAIVKAAMSRGNATSVHAAR